MASAATAISQKIDHPQVATTNNAMDRLGTDASTANGYQSILACASGLRVSHCNGRPSSVHTRPPEVLGVFRCPPTSLFSFLF
jgi:hypothetical protein